MNNGIALICFLLAVALSGGQGSAQRLPAYQAGSSDRANFEQWITTQSGAYRAGAEYWVAHRSIAREAHCNGRGEQLQGCLDAQRRLAPLDARRKAEPEYRLGWNGTPAADEGPSSASGYVTPPTVSSPQVPHAQSPVGLQTTSTLNIYAGLIFAALIAAFAGRLYFTAARQQRAVRIASKEIETKAHLLHVRREQLTQPDFYGTRDFKKWETEKSNFVQTRLLPVLASQGITTLTGKIRQAIFDEVETAACRPIDRSVLTTFSNPAVYSPDMDPVHYELYCALQLKRAGWATKPTSKTGDQGVDIFAERKGVTLVVQCKLYSGSVGNAAVQEVLAGRVFYRADLAVVVSNARFTKSARDLAGMSKVTLLHHSQLSSYTGTTDPMQLKAAAG